MTDGNPTPASIEDLVAKVWSKPEYAAADLARQKALSDDPNDQMSALAAAVDAALSSAQAEIERLREALRLAGRKLMAVENAVPIAKDAQKIILAALENPHG